MRHHERLPTIFTALAGIILLVCSVAASCATGSKGAAIGDAELACLKQAAPGLLELALKALVAGAASDPSKAIPVLDQVGAEHGFDDLRCVFLAVLAKPSPPPSLAPDPSVPTPAQRKAIAAWLAAR